MKKIMAILVFLGLLVGIGANLSLDVVATSKVDFSAVVDPEDFDDLDELMPRP